MGICRVLDIFMSRQSFIYKCVFLVYSIFLSTEFSQIKNFNIIKILIMLWGTEILIYDILKTKGKSLRKNMILVIFLILSMITIFMNNITANDIKLYAITLIQLLVLNNYDKNKDIDYTKKELNIFNFILIATTFLLTLAAILAQELGLNVLNIILFDSGRVEKLFKGFYVISTSAGLICYLSSAVTIIALFTIPQRIKNKIGIIILCICNLLVQTYALFKSGARGAIISFVAFIVIVIFMNIRSKKIRIPILFFITVMIICFPLYKNMIFNMDFLNKNPGTSFFSGRLTLWEEGYKHILKNKPLLGAAPDNMISEIKKLSTEDLIGIEGGRIHNIYLDVVYSNGLIGFGLLMFFIISKMINMYKYSFNYKMEKDTRTYIRLNFSLMTSMLVLNTVESILIYLISTMGIIFWVYMGYQSKLIKSKIWE